MSEHRKYSVVVSTAAKQMLGTHIRFIAQVSKESALTQKRQIMAALRSLENMPDRYPFFDAPFIRSYKYHKMFIGKYYLALYQIQDNSVYVDYILDCRKDYKWLL